VPAYVIFHDSTLRELARLRPANLDALRLVRGLGERKLLELGSRVLEHIARHERKRGVGRSRTHRS
jgi:ATP-dependent DNA helicase RecQ